ncbi:MAG: PucR family transcriptional regulator [Phototrophicaceae bacterium]
MLTVADALALDVFNGSVIVAGRAGLTRPVAWVHNAGVPNVAEWLNGGELLLTTAFSMPPDLEEQKQYIQALIDKGVAGLGIAIGFMIDRVPDELRAIADAHDFPLVEVPYELRFVDIAREINGRIAQENLMLFQRALNIQQSLTELVLQGGGIRQLAATLAEMINQSVSIETERFEALASVNIGPVDEARRYTQQFGRTDPRLVRALEDRILPEIRRTLKPVFIPQMPHVGLEMERILAPIVVHGEIYGYMWIIADDRPLDQLDHMAIESGATIAALMLLYQESLHSSEASVKGNLLARLIQGGTSGTMVVTDQALRYGVDLRQPFHALLIEVTHVNTKHLLDLYRRVDRLVTAGGDTAIVGQFAGRVMLLVQASESLDKLTERIHEELATRPPGSPVARIGVSGAHSGADRVGLAHAQCQEVLHIGQRLHLRGKTFYFDRLGYLHALYHAGPEALHDNPYVPGLRALLGEQQADLFHTLETYLDVGGNGVSTAETLHIHRSTLNYRLQRIAEIANVDLSDPVTRLNLQVAIKLLHLFEEN